VETWNEEKKPDFLTFDKQDVKILEGGKVYLNVSCDPIEILNDITIEFSSSDDAVAYIMEKDKTGGLVIGQSKGQSVISATVSGVTTRCIVTVE
jgi:hypothetical protein